MSYTDDKHKHTCSPDEEPALDLGNSQGIAPPSETAKSLMDAEGYVSTAGVPEADLLPKAPSRCDNPGVRVSHVDKFNRTVPKQRTWPK